MHMYWRNFADMIHRHHHLGRHADVSVGSCNWRKRFLNREQKINIRAKDAYLASDVLYIL